MSDKPLFVRWDDNDPESFNKAILQTGKRDFVARASNNSFQNISQPNVSVRQGYDRRDYDFFRPGEMIPTRDLDVIAACMQAYDKIGIIRNTIDMMSEFACQGIDLVHPNPRIEEFYKEWFAKVSGKDRTERILNLFYRAGNLVIKRNTAKLKEEDVNALRRGVAADVKVGTGRSPAPMEIPWEYVIYNPLSLEVYGSDLAPFFGQKYFKYGIRVTEGIENKINNPEKEIQKMFLNKMPKEVMDFAKQGGRLIPLDSNKITALSYKKDDWQVWARPMVYCVLEDLIMLRKMKLADLSALDGAVSHMRLWRLGSLEHKIMPTEAAISRLADMLMNNVGGGTVDLIWGPELDFKESSVDMTKFLGEEKYKPVLNNIFAGLGIPPGLTGLPASQGFSNNYISLRTLIERLEYGRDTVKGFWEKEIKQVQLAMGFRQPAKVVFDKHILSDEASTQRLLIELADRDLISAEALQERFDFIPEIEAVRLNRESRKRKGENMPPKSGPFHTDTKEAAKKIFAQNGRMGPKDFDIDATDPVDFSGMGSPVGLESQKGEPGQGRPPGMQDKEKRQKRTVNPTKAFFESMGILKSAKWSEGSLAKIESILMPYFLKSLNKVNSNFLTEKEKESFSDLTISVLDSIDCRNEITVAAVKDILTGKIRAVTEVKEILNANIKKFELRHQKKITIKDKKKMLAHAYAEHILV